MATADHLLTETYERLGYAEAEAWGSFLSPRSKPSGLSVDEWMEKGDWLSAAQRAGIDKVYFIDENPVVLFKQVPSEELNVVREACARAWSMARPRILFLATPTEIRIYDLGKKPSREHGETTFSPIQVAKSVAEIARQLENFSRESLDSGYLFESEKRFGKPTERADAALIADLRQVRQSLLEKGLDGDKRRFAHSLIGRAVFIRYLEERKVLGRDYFETVAKENPRWVKCLKEPVPNRGVEFGDHIPLFPRVLRSKEFTYALFRKITDDFNGDVFPFIEEESDAVTDTHLNLLQDLLYGDAGPQKNLFFQAYRFDIIPIELISSIYEEFYSFDESRKKSASDKKKHAAYYTPPSLAEFLVSRTLTMDLIAKPLKILDPACGSGIFLVECFRRIVRYRIANQGRRLRFDELRKILKDQIYGIDLNEDAIRIAAFSLYLSLLHYLEPEEIRSEIVSNKRLPPLVHSERAPRASNLIHADAFEEFEEAVPGFPRQGFDIVVGNPPWGPQDDSRLRTQQSKWLMQRKRPFADNERSQAFLWRVIEFLNPEGKAGMLVSSNVLFRLQRKSVEFRRAFFDAVRVDSVFNFSNVRNVFFAGAISPFLAILFGNEKKHRDTINYLTPKVTTLIKEMQVISLERTDYQFLDRQSEFTSSKYWKVFSWGNNQDWALIRSLQLHPDLKSKADENATAQGFKVARKNLRDSDWLSKYRTLPISKLSRYGELNPAVLEDPPSQVQCFGKKEIYTGGRLLVSRGVKAPGRILARYETVRCSFTHSINGIKLVGSENDHLLSLGILWSSLARYYYFLISSDWGRWHDEILLDEILSLPIPEDIHPKTLESILGVVNQLRRIEEDSLSEEVADRIQNLEDELDKLVFDAYRLSRAERERIKDFVDHKIALHHDKKPTPAVRISSTPDRAPDGLFPQYQNVFVEHWRDLLGKGKCIDTRIVTSSKQSQLLALVVTSGEGGNVPPIKADDWETLMNALEGALEHEMAPRIRVSRTAMYLFEDWAVIIKPNHAHLWTRTAAREDAESIVVEAINRADRQC